MTESYGRRGVCPHCGGVVLTVDETTGEWTADQLDILRLYYPYLGPNCLVATKALPHTADQVLRTARRMNIPVLSETWTRIRKAVRKYYGSLSPHELKVIEQMYPTATAATVAYRLDKTERSIQAQVYRHGIRKGTDEVDDEWI